MMEKVVSLMGGIKKDCEEMGLGCLVWNDVMVWEWL